MASSASDNFAKMFMPDHPHLRLHVLLSILALTVIVGSITLYKLNVSERFQATAQISQQRYKDFTQEEREQIISNLREQAAKSPPISEAQRKQIIENMKQAVSQENK